QQKQQLRREACGNGTHRPVSGPIVATSRSQASTMRQEVPGGRVMRHRGLFLPVNPELLCK
ncbi:MAG: hypothetical protein JXA18_13885, partial [Chitinispirillaceae bacterium]|nr:hypothetical protein [Chitinispirillaceae bacterium]